MKTLIVGAGGFGRELYWWLHSHADRIWAESFAGFLDDDLTALAPFSDYSPGVIGRIADYQPNAGDQFVLAIANPTTKLQIAESLEARGAKFATFVHSECITVSNARMGRGCVLCPRAGLSCDVTIGNFVTINCYSGVAHDARLDDGCTLSSYCDVMGGAQLGRGVFLASHACILPGVVIGNFAKVGAGSVTIRNVRPDTTVMGVPAARVAFEPKPSAS